MAHGKNGVQAQRGTADRILRAHCPHCDKIICGNGGYNDATHAQLRRARNDLSPIGIESSSIEMAVRVY
jgi:hypothetical protein